MQIDPCTDTVGTQPTPKKASLAICGDFKTQVCSLRHSLPATNVEFNSHTLCDPTSHP